MWSHESKEQKIRRSPETVIKDNGQMWGVLFGNVFFIKVAPDYEDVPPPEGSTPLTTKELTWLLNKLDEREGSRASFELINYFTGGSFILARSDKHAIKHHQLYLENFNKPLLYMQAMIESFQSTLPEAKEGVNFRHFLSNPIRIALAKGMFEITEFPKELNDAFYAFAAVVESVADDFEANVRFSVYAKMAPSLFMRAYASSTRDAYVDATTLFLNNQKSAILAAIHTFAKTKHSSNLIAVSIIQLIKEEDPTLKGDALYDYLLKMTETTLNKYLTRSEIVTIPASIFAGDNIVITFSCAVAALAMNPSLMDDFRAELLNFDIDHLFATNDFDSIKKLIDTDTAKNGLLHRVYLEALRREDFFKSADHLAMETLQTRYTKHPIEIGDFKIPADSTIVILPALRRFDDQLWQDPDAFDPDNFNKQTSEKYAYSIFSHGNRTCPAAKMTSYIFKTLLMYISSQFDLTLDTSEGTQLSKITVQCCPREVSEKSLGLL